jgi:hypothetical protein
MATSTIAMILIMVTMDRYPRAGQSNSTTSRLMRRMITRATWATLRTKAVVNMPCPDITAAVELLTAVEAHLTVAAAAARVITRARSN